jgi:hypothetical protein
MISLLLEMWPLLAVVVLAAAVHFAVRKYERRYYRRVVVDYAKKFPGQCLVCGLHRYGLYTADAESMWSEPHECIERSGT